MEDNLKAFLDTIRYCEGTSEPDGYNTLFGGDHFHSYDTHPNILVNKSGYKSTAAGAYQILYKTWVGIREIAGVKDFSPRSQDLMCKALIRRRGALLDVLEGRFRQAVLKCNKEWASLPESPYGQPTKNMDQIEKYYLSRGGKLS